MRMMIITPISAPITSAIAPALKEVSGGGCVGGGDEVGVVDGG